MYLSSWCKILILAPEEDEEDEMHNLLTCSLTPQVKKLTAEAHQSVVIHW